MSDGSPTTQVPCRCPPAAATPVHPSILHPRSHHIDQWAAEHTSRFLTHCSGDNGAMQRTQRKEKDQGLLAQQRDRGETRRQPPRFP